MTFPMYRRHFLQLSLATAGAALLSQCARSEASPAILTSQGGLLELNLEAKPQRLSLGRQSVHVLAYNGQIPGTRLEVRSGDTLRIHFTNSLNSPTNLHYHGLHIPPTGSADNAFLDLPPGESFTYEFALPPDHPAGTFWYHPHRHGLVAEQVFGGLAGLLIVRGDLDEIPEVQSASEEFLVLQDFEPDPNTLPMPMTHMLEMWGREGSLLTVNGQVNPTFTLPQDGLLRLRLLNASASRFYRLMLEDHPLYLIASDGGALAEPVEVPELLLTPGERAEVLIQGNRKAGAYRLMTLPYDRGIQSMMDGMMGGGMQGHMGRRQQLSTTPQVLATVVYGDRTTPLSLPQQLLPVDPLPEPQRVREFTLNHGMSPQVGVGFLINDKAFDHHRVDTQTTLDQVEDWDIINLGGMDHPFHLHVHPFQVVSRNGVAEPYRAWKDTVLVRQTETVRIRVAFRDFPGKTVYHCHILDHEDKGMMGILEVTT